MSAHSHANDHHHDDGHDHGHGHEHEPHGSFRSYVTGFVLSVILTVIPFWLVMGGVFENKVVTAGLILAFGLVQIVVHMIYFLHMNSKSEGGWTILALIFTIVIVVIALSGSL